MNLREKTLVILGLVFICAFIIILALSLTFYTNTFSDLERSQAASDLNRALRSVDNELSGLESITSDRAWWDDTYRFTQDHEPDYVSANLAGSTFGYLRLNYFVIISPNGTVTYSKGYDHETGQETPVPDALLHALPRAILPAGPVSPGWKRTGIIIIKGSPPVLVSSAEILTSALQGPGNGYLVMGRVMDNREIARLSEVSGTPIYLIPSSTSSADSTASLITLPLKLSTVRVDQTDPFRLTTETAILSSDGVPAITVGIRSPRDTYQSVLALIRNYLIIITVMMALFAGLVILLMDTLVLNRLSTLVDRVRDGIVLPEGQRLPPMEGNAEFVRLDTVITESQQKIRESEARYRRIIETSQEGIWILDGNYVITFANTRMAAMLGTTPAELAGRPVRDFILEEEKEDHDKRIAARKSGGSERYERRLVKKDGEILWALISATPVITGSGYAGSFAMITDITDRKRAELALALATKKLTTLNVLTFNDLQNQLFTLQGYLELSEGIAAEGKLKGYLSRQKEVANRIRQQIAFAHNIQKIGMKPPSWQNVNRVFLFAISHLDMSQVSRDIRLDNLEIYADPLFETVLYSLAENSLIHGKPATVIRLAYRRDGHDLVISFEDNGRGIPDEKKEEIFLQHFGSGTGISLFLAREILSITGITLHETGIFMQGARFEMRIPRDGYRFTGTGNPDTI